ncbi:MAG: hypothetical protein RIR14_1257 [Pseudomonadota bacterium]
MKKKLNDEEMQALLGVFEARDLRLRKVSDQGRAFRFAFYFVNIYSLSMIFLLQAVTRFFPEIINPVLFEAHHVDLLGRRAFAFLWILAALNIAFFFAISFRFVVVVTLLYMVNATFDQLLMIYGTYGHGEAPLFSAFFLSRPLLMLALVATFWFYKES